MPAIVRHPFLRRSKPVTQLRFPEWLGWTLAAIELAVIAWVWL
jgi:hypothetical protein